MIDLVSAAHKAGTLTLEQRLALAEAALQELYLTLQGKAVMLTPEQRLAVLEGTVRGLQQEILVERDNRFPQGP